MTVDELRRVCSEIPAPCRSGRTPILPARQLEEMGFATVTWPVSACYTIARALRETYGALLRDGHTNAVRERMVDFNEFNNLIDLPRVREAEAAYDDFARELVETADRAESP